MIRVVSDESMTGRLLVATPALEDPNFHRAVILVLDHDDDGALGVVINRASELRVGEVVTDGEPLGAGGLAGWELLVADPPVIFGGGPVEPDAVVALGRETADAPRGDAPIVGRVRLVDLSTGPVLAATEIERMRVFAGYAGWAPGQLEAEVAAGAWWGLDAEPDDVFTQRPERLWHEVLRRQGGELALLATFPADPSMN